MTEATHLGDGAYVSINRYGSIFITANHHDPLKATDAVVLDVFAINEMVRWLRERGVEIK